MYYEYRPLSVSAPRLMSSLGSDRELADDPRGCRPAQRSAW